MARRPDEAEWGRDLPFPPEYEPLDVLPMVVAFGLCLTVEIRVKDRLLMERGWRRGVVRVFKSTKPPASTGRNRRV